MSSGARTSTLWGYTGLRCPGSGCRGHWAGLSLSLRGTSLAGGWQRLMHIHQPRGLRLPPRGPNQPRGALTFLSVKVSCLLPTLVSATLNVPCLASSFNRSSRVLLQGISKSSVRWVSKEGCRWGRLQAQTQADHPPWQGGENSTSHILTPAPLTAHPTWMPQMLTITQQLLIPKRLAAASYFTNMHL